MKHHLLSLKKLHPAYYLGTLVALGTYLRFWDIAKASIWHDEGYTMMLAPMGPLEILGRTARDVHPPLYYEVLHFWMLIFGNSETAARGLSALFMIALIPLSYLLVRRLFDTKAAAVAALLITFGPFTIRYAQEARMYALVAFLLLLATYFMVRAVQDAAWRWWLLYAATLAAALYTHYFAIFIIVVHWIYIATLSSRKQKTGVFDVRWWSANFIAAGLFLPWLPIAYAQFSRVQTSFWIPAASSQTLPNTLMQFFNFTNNDHIPTNGKLALTLLFAAIIAINLLLVKKYRSGLTLFAAYATVGPILVFLLSFRRPIYVDRYFVFASVVVYILIGVWIAVGWPLRRFVLGQVVAIALTLRIFSNGIGHIHEQADHKMRIIGQSVSMAYRPGDEIISGEIYTFFDFSYYNQTGTQLKLLAPYGMTGYGESSLLYDRADSIAVKDYSELHPASGYVWVIGKTGLQDYFLQVPYNWHLLERIEAGYSVAQKYRVDSQLTARK